MIPTISKLIFREYSPDKCSRKRIIRKRLTHDTSLAWTTSLPTNILTDEKGEGNQGLHPVSWPPLPSHETSPTVVPTTWPRLEQNLSDDGNNNNSRLTPFHN